MNGVAWREAGGSHKSMAISDPQSPWYNVRDRIYLGVRVVSVLEASEEPRGQHGRRQCGEESRTGNYGRGGVAGALK